MEHVPVSRRTRLQHAIKDKALKKERKKRWFAARNNWRSRVSKDVKLEVVSDADDDEEESSITNIVKQNLIVGNKNIGGLHIATRCRNNEDSDDSLQIIGERWNPDYCYASHSSVSNSDSDCGTTGSHRSVEDEVGHSSKTDDGVSSDESNARENDFVGRRTRSLKKSSEKGRVRKRSRPFKTASLSKVSEPKNPESEMCTMPGDEKRSETVVKRKRGRPRKIKIGNKESSPKSNMQSVETNDVQNIIPSVILENGNIGLETCEADKESSPVETNGVQNIIASVILENENVGSETCEVSVNEASLPLKFSFRVQNSLSEKSEEEKERDELFSDLDFALRSGDVNCSISSPDEDEEDDSVISYEDVVVPVKLCRQGKHYLILEDEVGVRCKFCPFIELEIRDVTPDFHHYPFGRSERKELPPDVFLT